MSVDRRILVLMDRVVTLVLTGAVPTVAGAQQTVPSMVPLVIDKVTVVDVEQGKLVPDQRVIVVGNHVQAVGPMDQVRVPPGGRFVDAQGRYLIPGLWDMHTHPGNGDLMYPLLVANGITGIRSAIGDDPLPDQVQRRQEILDGSRVGPPRQLLAGRQLNSYYPGPFGPGLDGPTRLQRILDSLRTTGADFFKVYPLTFDLAAGARKSGVPFGGHVPRWMSAIEASDSGMSIVDHALWSGVNSPCLGDRRSIERCQPVVEAFQRNGTWWVPTLAIQARANYATRQMSSSLPIFARLDAFARAFWQGSSVAPRGNWLRDSTGSSTSVVRHPGAIVGRTRYLELVQYLGLPVLAGTDTGFDTHTLVPGFSLHAEMAMYVAEGLTPLTALQSATLNPAKLLHATDSLGIVGAGKLADLVLLNANPLIDITNTTTIHAVVANGRYFDRTALDRLVQQVQSKRMQNP